MESNFYFIGKSNSSSAQDLKENNNESDAARGWEQKN